MLRFMFKRGIMRALILFSLIPTAKLLAEADIRVVATGNLMGALKACHCPHGQPGGLARRSTIFRRIREKSPRALFIDCGRLTSDKLDPGESALLRNLVQRLDYDIVNCYLEDFFHLAFPPGQFAKPGIPAGWNTADEGMPDEINLPFTMRYSGDSSQAVFVERRDIRTSFYRGSQIIEVITLTANDETRGEIPVTLRHYVSSTGYDINRCSFSSEQAPFPMPDSVFTLVLWNTVEDTAGVEEPLEKIMDELHGGLENADLVIVGGGGYIEPEVRRVENLLYALPGVYGEYVLVIDLWLDDDNHVTAFEWEAVPSESALPDSSFDATISGYYRNQDPLQSDE